MSWLEEVRAAHAEGFVWFDWMDCVDEIGRAEEFRVIVRLLDPGTGEARQLETRVDRAEPVVPSIRQVYAGAAWAERELTDLFGISFDGGDPRPLLVPPGFGGYPLRKDEVLGARAAHAWPGAKEPGESGGGAPSRRRMVPPGVPDPQVWGDRDPDEPAAEPGEIAASVQGGRVRKRRTDDARRRG